MIAVFFVETYKRDDFEANGILETFVQDNHSRSTRGVLRGLHYQKAPHAQGKLIQVLKGEIYDVAVDIRRGSPTYGQWAGIHLSEARSELLYVPPRLCTRILRSQRSGGFHIQMHGYLRARNLSRYFLERSRLKHFLAPKKSNPFQARSKSPPAQRGRQQFHLLRTP